MTKSLVFKSEDVLGKDYPLIDSMEVVSKTNKSYVKLLEDMTKMEEKWQAEAKKEIDKAEKAKKENKEYKDNSKLVIPLIEYANLLNREAIDTISSLLDLDASDKKKLEGMSMGYLRDFVSQLYDKFAGVDYPSLETIRKNTKENIDSVKEEDHEDPKVQGEL